MGACVNRYNLRYLIWCIAAKYDCRIRQSPLGKRYRVNFGLEITTKLDSTIITDIESSLVARGFVKENYLLTSKKFRVYLNRNGYGLTVSIWEK